jgi:C-terminal processing protease CtpA/Prc
VIEHFLLCYEREQAEFQGLCGIGFRFQVTENEALRAKLKMQAHHTGVLVSLVSSQGPEAGNLQVGDVILEVDGVKVADDGTIPFRGTTWSEERISQKVLYIVTF